MKTKNKRLYLSVLLATFICFTGSTSISGPDSLSNMAQSLREKTDEIIALKTDNQSLKRELAAIQSDLADYKIADIPAAYFAKVGYFEKDNPYPRDPAFMRRIWGYCKKYRALLNADAETVARDAQIIPEYFVFFWIGKETHYNPNVRGENKDKFGRVISYDLNITQINSGSRKDPRTGLQYPTTDAWDYGFNQLPDELKRRPGDPTRDPEIGVAMLFIWINNRVKDKMAWAYLNDWTWFLYWQAKQVKTGDQGAAKQAAGGGQ